MNRLTLLCAGSLLLSACTLSPTPEVPLAPPEPPPPQMIFVGAPPEQLLCREDPAPRGAALDYRTMTRQAVAQPRRTQPVLRDEFPTPALQPELPARPVRPAQLIRAAESAALITPTERGYFGGSAVQRWVWQPNKIYQVYLSPGRRTKIQLPPGEVAIEKLVLDPSIYEVHRAVMGREATAFSVFFIEPFAVKGGEDVSILTEAGHSFDLRLVIAPKGAGMFGVTFTTTPTVQLDEEEQPVFPRPTGALR